MTALTRTIDWGTKLSSTTVNVYFAPAGETWSLPDAPPIVTEKWSAYARGQFMAAMETFENITNLNFEVTTNPVEATFSVVLYHNDEQGDLGVFGPPGYSQAGIGGFNINGVGWDPKGIKQGGLSWQTIIHEIGHGLGLAHPHDNGGSSTILPGLNPAAPGYPFGYYGAFNLNQDVFTMMSYNHGWKTGPDGSVLDFETFGDVGTPMAIDIAVLQQKYGANTEYRAGDNVYRLPTEDGPGTFYSCIWDAGGIDTVTAGRTHRGVTINLNAATLKIEEGGGGWMSFARGVHGGFTIANGVVIENATGGAGGDLLTGNRVGNQLWGQQGNDTISAKNGSDWVWGGSGNDTLFGNGGSDALFGGSGDDRLIGATGEDDLTGGLGDDLLVGGEGSRDTFIYSALKDSRGEGDRIMDFESSLDRIDLSGLTVIDAGEGFHWIGRRAFSGQAGELRFEVDLVEEETHILGDADGDSKVDFYIQLDGLLTLKASDFIL